MCSVHSVFHVSMLKPATSNTFSKRIQPAPTQVIIDREPEYEISRIVDSKINHRQACKLLYKVIWLGYKDTGDESEWIPASKLTYAADLVSDFHIIYPTKPGPLPLSWTHCCICLLSPCISNRDFLYLISLVYSVCLFSLTLSFCALFRVSSQNFQTSLHLILTFLTHTINSQEITNSIRKNKTKILTGGRWRSHLLLTFSGAILGPLLFISILLLPALFFWAPSPLHRGPNPLQLGYVPLLALHQVPEGLPDSLVLLHKFPECLFNST